MASHISNIACVIKFLFVVWDLGVVGSHHVWGGRDLQITGTALRPCAWILKCIMNCDDWLMTQ